MPSSKVKGFEDLFNITKPFFFLQTFKKLGGLEQKNRAVLNNCYSHILPEAGAQINKVVKCLLEEKNTKTIVLITENNSP